MAVNNKKQHARKKKVCTDCGQNNFSLDYYMRFGTPLSDDNEVIPPPEKDSTDDEEVRQKDQENLQTILAEQELQKETLIQEYGVKVSGKNEEISQPSSAPGEIWKKCLETYPVNEPYAYIAIEDSQPPVYRVCEASLTKGEEELLKDIRTWLYEVINVEYASLKETNEFLKQKVQQLISEFGIILTSLSM